MTPDQVRALDDAALTLLHAEVVAEQSRRADLHSIPNLIGSLTSRYRESGGDVADLVRKVEQPSDPTGAIV